MNYDTPSLVDYRETLGSVVYRIESSARSRYEFSASASRLNPEEDSQSTSRGEISLGYQADLSEVVTLNATLGAVRTSELRSKTNPVGALRIAYTGERAGYALGWSRNVSVGGSVRGYTRSETVDTSLTYPFTANTSLSFGFNQARSLEADREKGSTVYARIRSELTRFWVFTVGLENRRAKSSGAPTASGNSLALGLAYTHPDF